DLLPLCRARDLLQGARPVAAIEFDGAVDHHFRRVWTLGGELAGVGLLPERRGTGREWVPPAEVGPVIDVLAEHDSGRVERFEYFIGGWAAGAALRREQFHQHGHALWRGGSQ